MPGSVQRPLAVLRQLWPGLAFMGAGLMITLQGLAAGASEDVPAFAPLAAGLVFFLGGVLVTLHLRGAGDTILYRTLVALLVSGLAAVAVLFPLRCC